MLTRRRVSHTPSRFLSFFVDGAVCTLHAVLFSFFLSFIGGGGTPPCLCFVPPFCGVFFFFPRLYVEGGWCMPRPPSPLLSPPFLGVFFFCSRFIEGGAAYTPPAVPSSLVYPSEM